jgi:hypothetical protein
VASPATLDRIISNCLAIRLGDPDLAADVYIDLRQQVLQADERHYDTHVSVRLTPRHDGPVGGEGAMFVATVRWEYRVTPPPLIRRFSCVSDPVEYRKLLRDPTAAGVWLFDPTAHLNADSPEVFSLVQYTVNGAAQRIEHTHRPGAQLYTVTTNPDELPAGTGCHVSYTYRTLAPQHGHLLFLDFNRLTKGLTVEFTHTDCGIAHVNALDFIAGAQHPRVVRNPRSVPTPAINIGYDGWIFPKSGIAYTWTLHRELRDSAVATSN